MIKHFNSFTFDLLVQLSSASMLISYSHWLFMHVE